MIADLLAFAGIGAHPVLPEDLAARRPLLERRRDLLAAHLTHVEATAPADAGPHRTALALAQGELDWLTTRQAEEERYAEYNRSRPPGLMRDVREAMAAFFGR